MTVFMKLIPFFTYSFKTDSDFQQLLLKYIDHCILLKNKAYTETLSYGLDDQYL